MDSSNLYDIIIIGGGPAGLSAAQYASRAKLKTLVLDKSATAGAMAYASLIENYPGLSKPVPGRQLLETFREQAERFGAECKEAQVIGASLEGDVKEVFTMDASYSAKAVIIATGSMGRKAAIKGEAEFLGRGVSYCAICDAAFFKGRTVCVLGDSEEAVKEAGVLTRFAQTVYLISPSQKLKVEPDYPALLIENLKVIYGASVVGIEGADAVERIALKDSSGKESEMQMDGVFVYMHGTKPVVDFLQGALERGENECIVTDRMTGTSIAGVFAAGDVSCTEVRQVVIAAAQGCLAALAAEKHITGRKKTKLDWHG
ncbi:MAG: FAD-dependent oxidoreductase [Nitrospiraceae bacterium]|nr:FAD-dependent oxidoreductase [Nitrospiraceae bacterium]